MTTILLFVLVAPSVKRIVSPVERILIILLHLPAAIVLTFGLLGRHHTTQILTEVRCRTQFMIHTAIVEHERSLLQRVAHSSCKAIVLLHLRQHHIATLTGFLVTTYRIVERRVLAHTYQSSSLLHRKLLGFFREVSIGSRLDTDSVVTKVIFIEIHRKDFLLRVVFLKFHGNNPLDRLLKQTLDLVSCHLLGIQLLGQLLSQRTATTR